MCREFNDKKRVIGNASCSLWASEQNATLISIDLKSSMSNKYNDLKDLQEKNKGHGINRTNENWTIR